MRVRFENAYQSRAVNEVCSDAHDLSRQDSARLSAGQLLCWPRGNTKSGKFVLDL